MLLQGIGETGQARIRAAQVAIVGVGALGCIAADLLVRAGVGRIILIDRDVVEWTNLQRQTLFTEQDAADGAAKAESAAARLRAVDSTVRIRAEVADLHAGSIGRLLAGADLLVDGLDTFQARYLLNDWAVAEGRPYLYGGAVGTTGATFPVLPHAEARRSTASPGAVAWPDAFATPCLRCLFPEPPPPGLTPTCDTAGVLAPAVAIVAARQVAEAIKLLAGALDAVDRTFVSFDLWPAQERRVSLHAARNPECPCCARGSFSFLDGRRREEALTLCGRDTVQIRPPDLERDVAPIDLDRLAERLAPHGTFRRVGPLLRGTLRDERPDAGEAVTLTLFHDGRALLHGVTRPERARQIYARYVGG
ncbi:MAG: ThiF family adenylyltransferase [Phycisphaeraceae bacterium]|nr:ThiF family adenylyltransferase [Phycisphaeraceae bacterium]